MLADERIVSGGPGIDLGRQPATDRQRGVAVDLDLGRHFRVVGRIGDHCHELVVLGRAPQHRRPPDVDVLDRLLKGDPGARDGLLEGVEIDDHQIDRPKPVLLDRVFMRGVAANIEQPAMNPRMQGLDPAIEHFGKTGEIAQLDHRKPRLPQRPGGAARRKQFHARPGEGLGERNQTGLVENGEKRALNLGHIGGAQNAVPPKRESIGK